MLASVTATRYVTPLREGGSLPGIVEADDLGTYVCKFRGAGQGTRVLVAEVIVSGLAQQLGLSTPRLVVLDLDPAIAGALLLARRGLPAMQDDWARVGGWFLLAGHRLGRRGPDALPELLDAL